MCDKSLASETCDSNASCGISVRFQTLSPSHRQIPHALLTRPPLIGSRSSVTVRLECVKHAASVHPEPGSNSLKNGILNSLFRVNLKSFSELFFLSFFYFSTLCSKLLTRIFFVLFVCCSIFKDRFAPLVSSAHVVYHNYPTLSTLFFKKFHLFSFFFMLTKNRAANAALFGYFKQNGQISASKASTAASLVAQDVAILTRWLPFSCKPQSSKT